MQAIGLTKPRGAVKAKSSLSARGTIRKAQSRDFQSTSHCWEYAEHKSWDLELQVGASHKLVSITSLPFVHTARRYYRLNGPVRTSDWL